MNTKDHNNKGKTTPPKTLGWNLYGDGFDNFGLSGKPESFEVREPDENEILVRVDAVGVCYSDVKLIQQGQNHPKLHNQDLKNKPARLGHEVALTVIQVGEKYEHTFKVGDRLTIQPDIFVNGKSTAYGYVIPGGFIQHQILGPDILEGEAGSYAIKLKGELGLVETALTEPWACVEAAYTQRRRLEPKSGGIMWIVGQPGDNTKYSFPLGENLPGTLIVTDIPEALLNTLIEQTRGKNVRVEARNNVQVSDYIRFKNELTETVGFDDIVLLNPASAEQVSQMAQCLAYRGTMNLIGNRPLEGMSQIDAGRLHYDYTAYLGNRGPDISKSYGESRNRCDLRRKGTAVFVGAGGPMGQMHVQRAIELVEGPDLIIAVDVNNERLDILQSGFSKLADNRGKTLLSFNPEDSTDTLYDFVMKQTTNQGADDVVVCAPSAKVMAESARVMAPDGMLVLFAGVPNGTMIPLNLSSVYLHNAQYTGTSGSGLHDQEKVIEKTLEGELSPNRSVAAIGGIEAVREGVQAACDGKYPGKVVIFPQISGLKLTGLNELKTTLPDIASLLGEGDSWTIEAEKALIEKFGMS